jgi:hypothetical protein
LQLFSLGPQPEEYTSPILSGTLIGGGAEGWAGHEGRTKAREKGAEIREESGPIYRNAKNHDWDHVCFFSFWNFMIWDTHVIERQHILFGLLAK